MGKYRVSKLFAGQPTQAEPQDSWMRELQLQTVSVDPVRWTQRPQSGNWWSSFERHSRPRRPH